jgi:hypothetical protein
LCRQQRYFIAAKGWQTFVATSVCTSWTTLSQSPGQWQLSFRARRAEVADSEPANIKVAALFFCSWKLTDISRQSGALQSSAELCLEIRQVYHRLPLALSARSSRLLSRTFPSPSLAELLRRLPNRRFRSNTFLESAAELLTVKDHMLRVPMLKSKKRLANRVEKLQEALAMRLSFSSSRQLFYARDHAVRKSVSRLRLTVGGI